MSLFLTTERPTEQPAETDRQHVRRREVPYYHRHTVHRSTWLDWLIAAAVFSCVLALVTMFSGCVSTQFTSGTTSVTRTSVFSDVQVEATLGADGSITVHETQAQDAMGKLIDRIPAVTP